MITPILAAASDSASILAVSSSAIFELAADGELEKNCVGTAKRNFRLADAPLKAGLSLPIEGSRVRKFARRFSDEGHADIDLRSWFISHADLIGEAGVRTVMRGRHA